MSKSYTYPFIQQAKINATNIKRHYVMLPLHEHELQIVLLFLLFFEFINTFLLLFVKLWKVSCTFPWAACQHLFQLNDYF